LRFRFMLFLVCALLASFGCFDGIKAFATDGDEPRSYFDRFTKEEKVLYLNAGVFAAIGLYGFFEWDYGANSPHADSEGWFGRTTKHGGADKLGHLWSAHAMSHLFSAVYGHWGYEHDRANTYGALSSLGAQTFMEFADSFSNFGLSYEDLLMDFAGAATGYIWGRYPALASKVDFRMEYTPEFKASDFDPFTDYQNQRYLLAFKPEGFECLRDTPLSFFELHVGYFTRGFEGHEEGGTDRRQRSLYAGVGINVGRVLRALIDERYHPWTQILNYFQIPYTDVRLDHDLD
jgi:uncharacterized protein YfiM (DUF2279 family)